MTKEISNSAKLKSEFLEQMHSPQQLERLYEYLPDVFFFAKNIEGQFVMANRIFVEKCGCKKESDIIGRNDYDLFPRDRAHSYTMDDQYVMKTGKDLVNKVELSPEIDGAVNWFVTSKVPLYSKDGKIIGLAGTARDAQMARSAFNPLFEMSQVVEYIRDNYPDPVSITTLASIANLSISQFERKFKKIFQTTPVKHITKVRINAACQKLVDTNESISNIALECGFYDHSHFTKHFIRAMGVSPKDYRKTTAP